MYEEYINPQEIKSETKVGFGLYAFDFFFLIFYAMFTYILGNIVHDAIRIPYYIFSCIMGLTLTIPSPLNKKRRNYQSIIIMLRKDINVYRPVKNISQQIKKEKKGE